MGLKFPSLLVERVPLLLRTQHPFFRRETLSENWFRAAGEGGAAGVKPAQQYIDKCPCHTRVINKSDLLDSCVHVLRGTGRGVSPALGLRPTPALDDGENINGGGGSSYCNVDQIAHCRFV